MYRVTREIKFCFGHRLMNYEGKCRHLHGHNARAHFTVASKSLDPMGMAMDFALIKRLVNRWIDENLDHRAILHWNDPLFQRLQELGEPVFGIDVPPTTENLAKLLFDRARDLGVPVVEVGLWENDASCAVYTPDEVAVAAFQPAEESDMTPAGGPSCSMGRGRAGFDASVSALPSAGNGPFYVTREIKFCFGHRLMDYQGKCRQVHGHNGRLLVTVESAELDSQGLSTDFVQIKRAVQRWIEDEWDHSMLLHREDPLVPVLRKLNCNVIELEENPTTENLAKLIHRRVLAAGLNVTSVQLWETDSCSATYAPGLFAAAPDRAFAAAATE